MTGQNDRRDESLTSQVRDQAGRFPLTGLYFPSALLIKLKTCIRIYVATDCDSK